MLQQLTTFIIGTGNRANDVDISGRQNGHMENPEIRIRNRNRNRNPEPEPEPEPELEK